MDAVASKRAILLIHVNAANRGFFEYVLPGVERYAKRCDASLHVVVDSNVEIPPQISDAAATISPKRDPILPYILKVYYLGTLLEAGMRVLLLDDSCVVKETCPSLFDVVPGDAFAAYAESERRDFRSWKTDGEFLKRRRPGLTLPRYFNAGVMCAAPTHAALFSAAEIVRHIDLFESAYPLQAFVNYQVHTMLPEHQIVSLTDAYNFNPVPQHSRSADRLLHMLPREVTNKLRSKYIIHITGYFRHRADIIKHVIETIDHQELGGKQEATHLRRPLAKVLVALNLFVTGLTKRMKSLLRRPNE